MLRLFLLLLPLLQPALPQQTDCPHTLPRGEVACYWDGGDAAPLHALDPCQCSLLVVRGTGFSAGYQPHSAVDLDLLKSLKAKNPNLRTVLSLGGPAPQSTIFEEVASTKKAIANFTEEVAAFVKEKDFDGVEIDWQWPGQKGGSKDKDDLTRLVKNLRASFDILNEEASTHNVERRSADDIAETTTTTTTTSTSTTTPTTTTTSSPSSTSTTSGPSTTTTTTAASYESGSAPAPDSISTGLDLTTMLGDFLHYAMGTAYPEEDTENSTATESSSTATQDEEEDYYTPSSPVKISTSVSSSSSSISSSVASEEPSSSSGWTWPLDEESPRARDRSHGIIMMRLPQRPEYLVKGYDLKRLSSMVDLFSIGTDNLTTSTLSEQHQTYHPARLMGVADIENADSQVDLVNGLGVPLDRILLGVPARGLVFTLQNDDVTMPRAPALGPPVEASYAQVCQLMSEGEWTMERDEDLTAPYAFMNNTWVAFDDAMSLKIKSKYALLRELAGVALHDLADDDWKGTCGGDAFPLLSSVWNTFSQLVRTPRKAVLESLVEDLETSESAPRASYSAAPTHSRTFSTSPFKIVRIVDRNGDIRALRSNENSDFECTRQGYYRNPGDCSQFYRCVKFDQYIDDYTVFEYECPTGLVFDDRWEVCAWPSAAPPCDGSSEIFPVPRMKNVCPGDGFFADPENCRWFFACKDYYGNGTYMQYEFRCPFGLAYDEENGICNWSWLVDSCGDAGIEPQRYQNGGATIQPIPVNQVAGGLFGDRGGRGRGKEVGGGSRYPQGLDKDSDEDCPGCGGSTGVQIGGAGTYDPQRGIVLGYDVAEKAGLDSDYNAPRSQTRPSKNNNQISTSKQLRPQSSTSSGSSSGSRGSQKSGAIEFGSYTPPSRSSPSGRGSQSGAKSLAGASGSTSKGRRTQTKTGYSGRGDNQSDDSDEYSFPSATSYRAPQPQGQSYGARLSKTESSQNSQGKDSGVGAAPSRAYGLPSNTQRQPSNSYKSSRQPTAFPPSNYGAPQNDESSDETGFPQVPSTLYGPPQSSKSLSDSYEQPRIPVAPKPTYGIRQTIEESLESYEQPRYPSAPSTSYGTPQIAKELSESYEQPRYPSAPSTSYGTPQNTGSQSGSYKSSKSSTAPSTSYGTPNDFPAPSPVYGQPEFPQAPSTSYGTPQEEHHSSGIGAVPSSSTSYSPPSTIGAQISESYLPPYSGKRPSDSGSSSSFGGKQISKETVSDERGSVDGSISTYSYPEPDVPFNPTNSQKNKKASSYTYIEPHISTFPEPPPPYGLENIEPPSDENYDKSMYGDNVQSSKSYSGPSSSEKTYSRPVYQQEMPASIFIKIDDDSSEAKSSTGGYSSGSPQQSGYAYGEPARPFNPFAPTTSYDQSEEQSDSSSNEDGVYSPVRITPAPIQYTTRAPPTYTRRPTTQYTTARTPSYTTARKQEYRPRPSTTTSRPQSTENDGYSYDAPGKTFNPFQSSQGERETYGSSKDSSEESSVISTSSHFSLPTSSRGNKLTKQQVSGNYKAPQTTTKSKSSKMQSTSNTYSRNSDELSQEQKSGGYSYSAPSAVNSFNPFESPKKEESRETISYHSGVTSNYNKKSSESSRGHGNSKSNDKSSESLRGYGNSKSNDKSSESSRGYGNSKSNDKSSESSRGYGNSKSNDKSSESSRGYGNSKSNDKSSESSRSYGNSGSSRPKYAGSDSSSNSRDSNKKTTYSSSVTSHFGPISSASPSAKSYTEESQRKPYSHSVGSSSSGSANKGASLGQQTYGKTSDESSSGSGYNYQAPVKSFNPFSSSSASAAKASSSEEEQGSRNYGRYGSDKSQGGSVSGSAASHFGLSSSGNQKQQSTYHKSNSQKSKSSNSYSGKQQTSSQQYTSVDSNDSEEKSTYKNKAASSHFGQSSSSHFGQGSSSHFGQGSSSHFGQGTSSHFGQGTSSHFGQASSAGGYKHKSSSGRYGSGKSDDSDESTSYSKSDSSTSSGRQSNSGRYQSSSDDSGESKSYSKFGSSTSSAKHSGTQRYGNDKSEEEDRASYTNAGSVSHFGGNSGKRTQTAGSTTYGRDKSDESNERYSNGGASSHFSVGSSGSRKQKADSRQYGKAETHKNSGRPSYSSKPESDESDSDKGYNYAAPSQSFNPFSSKSVSDEDRSSSGSKKYSEDQSSERNSYSSGGSSGHFGPTSGGHGKNSGSNYSGRDESNKSVEKASYTNSGGSNHFGVTASSASKQASSSGQYSSAQSEESSTSYGTSGNSGTYKGTGANTRDRKKISSFKSHSKSSSSSSGSTGSSAGRYGSSGSGNQGGSYSGSKSQASKSSGTSSGTSHFQASSHTGSQSSGSYRAPSSGNKYGKDSAETGSYKGSSGSGRQSSSSSGSTYSPSKTSSSSRGSGYQGASGNDRTDSDGDRYGHFGGLSSNSQGKKSQTGYGSNDDSEERKSSSKSYNSGSSNSGSTSGYVAPSRQTYGSGSGKQSGKSGSSGSIGHFGGPVTSPTNAYGKPKSTKSSRPPTTPNVSPYGKHLANPTSLGVRVPVNEGPSLVAKLGGYEKKTSRKGPQRFGPGGFRDFDDTLGPEVCERAGLFRHPDSCDKFYECYWDRWVEKFTLHVFDCPVTIVYDSGITACNWPFNGPPCTDERHA